jgi:hypothetical protein
MLTKSLKAIAPFGLSLLLATMMVGCGGQVNEDTSDGETQGELTSPSGSAWYYNCNLPSYYSNLWPNNNGTFDIAVYVNLSGATVYGGLGQAPYYAAAYEGHTTSGGITGPDYLFYNTAAYFNVQLPDAALHGGAPTGRFTAYLAYFGAISCHKI